MSPQRFFSAIHHLLEARQAPVPGYDARQPTADPIFSVLDAFPSVHCALTSGSCLSLGVTALRQTPNSFIPLGNAVSKHPFIPGHCRRNSIRPHEPERFGHALLWSLLDSAISSTGSCVLCTIIHILAGKDVSSD